MANRRSHGSGMLDAEPAITLILGPIFEKESRMSKCPQQGKVWVFAAVAILVGAGMAGAGVADFTWDSQVMPETVGTPRDPGERAAGMAALQKRLVAGQVA